MPRLPGPATITYHDSLDDVSSHLTSTIRNIQAQREGSMIDPPSSIAAKQSNYALSSKHMSNRNENTHEFVVERAEAYNANLAVNNYVDGVSAYCSKSCECTSLPRWFNCHAHALRSTEGFCTSTGTSPPTTSTGPARPPVVVSPLFGITAVL